MKALDFLNRANLHMNVRAATYDAPEGERSMSATVEAFNAITGHELNEEQGWMFMSILKKVRSQQGEYKQDSYEDDVAYAALAGEAAYKARAVKQEPVLEYSPNLDGQMPCHGSNIVEVVLATGDVLVGKADSFAWGLYCGSSNIVSYRMLEL